VGNVDRRKSYPTIDGAFTNEDRLSAPTVWNSAGKRLLTKTIHIS
jgi:hypothetical protein